MKKTSADLADNRGRPLKEAERPAAARAAVKADSVRARTRAGVGVVAIAAEEEAAAEEEEEASSISAKASTIRAVRIATTTTPRARR
jgi:hypothetical protein